MLLDTYLRRSGAAQNDMWGMWLFFLERFEQDNMDCPDHKQQYPPQSPLLCNIDSLKPIRFAEGRHKGLPLLMIRTLFPLCRWHHHCVALVSFHGAPERYDPNY